MCALGEVRARNRPKAANGFEQTLAIEAAGIEGTGIRAENDERRH
jgi:hypothetical protein